jgi:hypothetical protein
MGLNKKYTGSNKQERKKALFTGLILASPAADTETIRIRKPKTTINKCGDAGNISPAIPGSIHEYITIIIISKNIKDVIKCNLPL